MSGFYDIEVEAIDGEVFRLERYRGNVLLVVNTASRCGFTGQYADLQKLYDGYSDKGLVILGFPSNDFLWQEPGSNQEIQSFCRTNYGVSFPMFGKIRVKGQDQHPLYRHLTSKSSNPEFSGRISWNFNKFLISRDGRVVGRFGSKISPSDPRLVSALQTALEQESLN